MKKSLAKSISISIVLGIFAIGCSVDGGGVEDDMDTEVNDVVQTEDLSTLSYTVQVEGVDHCDVSGVEVETVVPISHASTVNPGQKLVFTHKIGKVKKDKKKTKEFSVALEGALVETQSITSEVSEIDKASCDIM